MNARIFIVGKSSAYVYEPIKFDDKNCMWADADRLKPLVPALADSYESWLKEFGASYNEFEVRLVDMYGKSVECETRMVEKK